MGNSVTDANGVAYANLRHYGYSGGDANVGGGGGYDGPGIMGVQTLKGSGLGRMPSNTFDGHHALHPRHHNGGRSVADLRIGADAGPVHGPKHHRACHQTARGAWQSDLCVLIGHAASTVYRVDLNGWNGTNQLRLTGLASAELKLKIDNGTKPRIYVDTRDAVGLPTGPVIPAQARLRGTVRLCRQDHLDLETPHCHRLDRAAGCKHDEVFSGTRADLLRVRRIRSSAHLHRQPWPVEGFGLQDPNDAWDDTCAVSGGIDAAAKNALGPDGLSPLIERCLPVRSKSAWAWAGRSGGGRCERQIIAPMVPALLYASAHPDNGLEGANRDDTRTSSRRKWRESQRITAEALHDLQNAPHAEQQGGR